MENRALLAFIISMILITLWTFWLTPKRAAPPDEAGQEAAQKVQEMEDTQTPLSMDRPSVPVERDIAEHVERTVAVETPLYIAEFSSRGGILVSWKLKAFRESLSEEAPLIDLVSSSPERAYPLELRLDGQIDEGINSANYEFDRDAVHLRAPHDKATLRSSHSFSNGLSVVKEFTFHGDRYEVDLAISICDNNGKPISDELSLVWPHTIEVTSSRWGGYAGPVMFAANKFEEVKDIGEFPPSGAEIQWAGFTLKYFLTAIVPLSNDDKRLFLEEADHSVNMLINQTLDSPSNCRYHYQLFLGPKQISELKKSEHHLDMSVHFGFFDIIAKPLLITLITVNKYTHNYGIAIIILTILIKLLFWPLTHKSYASMKEMQKIQPRMKQIRERFKNDKEQMNREMMLLYKTHKVNPLGGCLPMLLQIPVFFALYRALLGSIELRHAPFIFWVQDLGAPDYLVHFPAGVSFFGIEGIGPLPLLMGASMLIQQKLTPTMGDPTQAKIMMLMPIFFTFIFISFPTGLVLYWLINNVLSIVQQVYINSKLQ